MTALFIAVLFLLAIIIYVVTSTHYASDYATKYATDTATKYATDTATKYATDTASKYIPEYMISSPPTAYSAYINGSGSSMDSLHPITGLPYIPSPQTPGVGFYGNSMAYKNALSAYNASNTATTRAAYVATLMQEIKDQSTLLQSLFNTLDAFPTGYIDGNTYMGSNSLSAWTQAIYNNLKTLSKQYVATAMPSDLDVETGAYPIFMGFFSNESAFCIATSPETNTSVCSSIVPYALDGIGDNFAQSAAMAKSRGHRYMALAKTGTKSGFIFTFMSINTSKLQRLNIAPSQLLTCTDTQAASCGCGGDGCPTGFGYRVWAVYQLY